MRCLILIVLVILSGLSAPSTHEQDQGQSAPTLVILCNFRAYIVDKDPKGLNVRSGAGSNYPVLAALKDDTASVTVTGVNGLWLRISGSENVEGQSLFDGEGWVYGPLIGVSARSLTQLHEKSQVASRVIGIIEADAGGNVVGCRDKWVQVEYKKKKGWMEPGSYCGNPVTTCP